MKITTQQYAKSLYEATEGKSPKEIGVLVSNFIKILIRNKQKKLLPKISQKFEEIWNKEKGIVKADVITKFEMKGKDLDEIKEYIRKKYKAKEVFIKNIVDEKIKGGIIIKVGDEVMDGSIRGYLGNLRKKLSV